jgi:hypothetical protein
MNGDWLLFAKVIGGIVAALWLVVLLIEAFETRRLRKLMPTTTAEERVELARLQAATFSGPAAKGFQKPLTIADRDAIVWEGFEKMRGARR